LAKYFWAGSPTTLFTNLGKKKTLPAMLSLSVLRIILRRERGGKKKFYKYLYQKMAKWEGKLLPRLPLFSVKP
jgi:hypothetical protein